MSIIKNPKEGKCEIRKAVFIYMRVIVLLKFKQFSKTFLNFLKQRKIEKLNKCEAKAQIPSWP